MSEPDRDSDDIDPRWLDPPYRPEWDRDPPWRREDRARAERARAALPAKGLASVRPGEPGGKREAG